MIKELIYLESPITHRHGEKRSLFVAGKKSKSKRNDPIFIEHIITVVLQVTGQTVRRVKSKSREKEIVHARHLLCYFLYLRTGLTLKSIGEMLGCRDHTTVIHGRDTVMALLANDDLVQGDVKIIKSLI